MFNSSLNIDDFHGDAIILSGPTGTKLKSRIIGRYYQRWWDITSGGNSKEHQYNTAIIELNAATGEDYIKDTGETLLGSSGHALELKLTGDEKPNLFVILVEEDPECFKRLQNVIVRRWPYSNLKEISPGVVSVRKGPILLLNLDLKQALKSIGGANLGNCIYFFDPLLYTPFSEVSQMADYRVRNFYQTRTEFILFVFTSDWFNGRNSLGLTALPETDESLWSPEEKKTVEKADSLFGDTHWRNSLIRNAPVGEKIDAFVKEYSKRLHRWFRYVLPLPFEPKTDQFYHLFFTSNYEDGITITKRFYTESTGNIPQDAKSSDTYKIFKERHGAESLFFGLKAQERPLQWKILWDIIKNHEEGLCDIESPHLVRFERDEAIRQAALEWLEENDYLDPLYSLNLKWELHPQIYQLNWEKIESALGVKPPKKLVPLHPDSFK